MSRDTLRPGDKVEVIHSNIRRLTIVFLNGKPVRVFKNNKGLAISFAKNLKWEIQKMEKKLSSRDPSRRPKRRFALHGADTNYVYGLFVKNRSGGAWHQKALFKTKEEAHRFRFRNGYRAYSKKLPDRGVVPSPWRISKVRIEDLPMSEYNLFKSRDPGKRRTLARKTRRRR